MAELYCFCDNKEPLGNKILDNNHDTFKVQTLRAMRCIKTGAERNVLNERYANVDIFQCPDCLRYFAKG